MATKVTAKSKTTKTAKKAVKPKTAPQAKGVKINTAKKAVAEKKKDQNKKKSLLTVLKKSAPKKAAPKKAAPKKAAPKKAAPKKAGSSLRGVKPAAAKLKAAKVTKVINSAQKAAKAKSLPDKMCEAAQKILHDRKAENIVVVDLRGRSALADFAIIASGNSARQLAAIASYIDEAFTKLGVTQIRVEGLPQGDWVLIDSGDVLIHLFRPEVRTYYGIEEMWAPSAVS